MGRILGIDFGTKRIGLAVSDPLKMIANGLTTIDTREIWSFLDDYFKKETIEKIVIGYPVQNDGSGSQSLIVINPFIKKFQQKYTTIPIVQTDERFTSKLAMHAMITGGVKKKDRQNKGLIDKVSATIILQEYLNSLQTKMNK